MAYPVNIVPWLRLPLASAVPDVVTAERTMFLLPQTSAPVGEPFKSVYVPLAAARNRNLYVVSDAY